MRANCGFFFIVEEYFIRTIFKVMNVIRACVREYCVCSLWECTRAGGQRSWGGGEVLKAQDEGCVWSARECMENMMEGCFK